MYSYYSLCDFLFCFKVLPSYVMCSFSFSPLVLISLHFSVFTNVLLVNQPLCIDCVLSVVFVSSSFVIHLFSSTQPILMSFSVSPCLLMVCSCSSLFLVVWTLFLVVLCFAFFYVFQIIQLLIKSSFLFLILPASSMFLHLGPHLPSIHPDFLDISLLLDPCLNHKFWFNTGRHDWSFIPEWRQIKLKCITPKVYVSFSDPSQFKDLS